MVAALYHSWRARNGRVHNKPFPLPRVIAALVHFSEAQEQSSSNVGNWDPNRLQGCCYPSASHWDPPPPRWNKVNFDGSVKQNGAAGAGGVVRDHCGNLLLAAGSKLYTQATLTAEVTGVLIALTAAQEWADTADGIWIEGDSAITIADLHRTARGHPPDRTMAQISTLFNAFKAHRISHVYRAANRAADFIASFSYLDNTEWRRGMSLPLDFCAILNEDRTFCT
ncbi:Putative ribonuclease H protein [Apostasia shenzhenica]|uniref:Ribonuclease H protein n=1 Tax=Apostasia shenzhenica TaxID=1088818 RepID=A0A2I0AGU2_9ASPA|nr:Putative ribonuclease H protein [Apostasia shenzhenica]